MTYWISTGLLCSVLATSSIAYLCHNGTIDGIRDLGFPDHFRVQLAILKLLAVVVILLPMFSVHAKDWAYAGVSLFFITSIVAHTAHGDPWTLTLVNCLFIILVGISRYSL